MSKYLTLKQLVVFLSLFTVLFAVQGYLIYRLIIQKSNHKVDMNNINEAMDVVSGNLVNMLNIESSQRGYMLTMDSIYLAPYKVALQDEKLILKGIKQRQISNESKNLFAQIALISNKRLEYSNTIIQFVREGKIDSSFAMMKTGRGRILMDSIRGLTKQLEAGFNIQIDEHEQTERKSIYLLMTLLFITITLQITFTFFIVLWQNNSLETLQQKQERLDKILFMTYHDCKEPMRNIVSNLQLFEKRNTEKIDHESKGFIHGTIAGVKQMEQTVLKLRSVVEKPGNN